MAEISLESKTLAPVRILEILELYTDENHPLTQDDILTDCINLRFFNGCGGRICSCSSRRMTFLLSISFARSFGRYAFGYADLRFAPVQSLKIGKSQLPIS